MYSKVLIGERLVNWISAYASQIGGSKDEKDAF